MATQEEVLRHVGFHWWMLRGARHVVLTSPTHGRRNMIIYNAASAAFNVSARALADFFFDSGAHHADDLAATLLGMPLVPLPGELRILRTHVNKRVVHLTDPNLTDKRDRTLDDNPIPPDVERCLGERIEMMKLHLRAAMPTNWLGDHDVEDR